MRIGNFILSIILLGAMQAAGQNTTTVELKPIIKSGWKYYYGGKKAKSIYALQIPLEALEDEEINNRMRKFKTFQTVGKLAYLPALLYLFSSHGSTYHWRRDFLNNYLVFVGAGVLGDLVCNELAHHQMAKAIDVYNVKIAKRSSIGLTINRMPYQNMAALSYSFKF